MPWVRAACKYTLHFLSIPFYMCNALRIYMHDLSFEFHMHIFPSTSVYFLVYFMTSTNMKIVMKNEEAYDLHWWSKKTL